jgi:hypothetical protein
MTAQTIELATLAANHAPVLVWINDNAKKNNFAASLKHKIAQYKSLTANQLAAVEKALAPKAAPAAVSQAAMAQVQQAFDNAIASGIKRPKLRLADFILSPAKATSANAGAIYVNDAKATDADGQRVYLGKILGGEFSPAKACTPLDQQAIVAVSADPLKEAIAYGRKTGVCACCGRELTDPESIERGIGPICASKWFNA